MIPNGSLVVCGDLDIQGGYPFTGPITVIGCFESSETPTSPVLAVSARIPSKCDLVKAVDPIYAVDVNGPPQEGSVDSFREHNIFFRRAKWSHWLGGNSMPRGGPEVSRNCAVPAWGRGTRPEHS